MIAALAVVAIAGTVFRLGTRDSAAVVLSDPVVWVEDGARGRILQINGSTREIIGEVAVADDSTSLMTALPNGRDVAVLNRTSGQFAEVGAASLAPSNEFDTELGQQVLEQARFLGGMSPETEQHFSYLITEQNVLVFTGGANEPLNIPISTGLGDAVTDSSGRLIAVSPDDDQLLISTSDGLVLLTELPEQVAGSADPVRLVKSGQSVFVLDSSRRTVQRLDTQSGELSAVTSMCGRLSGSGLGGNHLTSSAGVELVIVHDGADGVLSFAEPSNGDCTEFSIGEDGNNYGPPVAVDGMAYLPNYETGQVLVVNLEDRELERVHPFTTVRGQPFELEVFDGVVWANEPLGARAAVVTPSEIVTIVKQERVRIVGVGDEGSEAVGGDGFTEDTADQRVFGDAGELFEGFSSSGEAAVAGSGVAPEGTEDSVAAGAAGPDPDAVATEVLSEEVSELVASPIILEAAAVEVNQEALVANFSFSSDVLAVGEEVRLTDESTGTPTQWNWDFGDGTGADGPETTKTWTEEGLYIVTMVIMNAQGDEAVQTHEFTVVPADIALPPSANFTFPSDTIEVGEPLRFTSTSTGDPETLAWTFGDGTVGQGQVVEKTFQVEGIYEVSLTASNGQGSDTETATITVVPGGIAPQAVIGNAPTSIVAGQSLALVSESTNSPTSTDWDFGDGAFATGREVFHSWDDPGEYRITLTVSNAAGEDTTFRTIVVEPAIDPPVARFNESDLEVIVGETLSFNDQSLNNPSSIVWEFGNGTTAQGPNVTNSWNRVGRFTVTLTVTNEAGSDSTSKTVTVLPEPVDPPVASFRVASTNATVGEILNFIDTSTGDPTSWSWDFGDGSPARPAQNPAGGFNQPGTYEVTLTATNAGGSSQFSRTIIVADPPIASFTTSAVELAVEFNDTTINGPTSWLWDFGDGTSSTVPNPVKIFTAPGTYTVSLVASNTSGDSTPFTTTVTVAEKPEADFKIVSINGLTVAFENLSRNAPTSYSWDFDDGVTQADPSFERSYTFRAGGTYDVTLTASNAAGSDDITIPVTVTPAPPKASINCGAPVNDTVTCSAAGSSNASSYAWSASPNATSITQVGDQATLVFGGNGTYTVEVVVTSADNQTDDASDDVTIALPVPDITNISVQTNLNAVVQLGASATNSPTDWTWTIPGDATISGGGGSSPTITFASAGSFTVTAVASNNNGASNAEDIDVFVELAPTVVSVSGNADTAGLPGQVTLSADTTNAPTSYLWTVTGSDEGTSTSVASTFNFATNGNNTYSGTLVVSNTLGGSSATFPFTVVIDDIIPAPTISIDSASDSGTGAITASATPTPATAAVDWTVTDSGGGFVTSANGTNVTLPVPANGNYTVTAIATNGGLTATDTTSVTVSSVPPPAPTVTFTATPGAAGTLQATVTFTGTVTAPATYLWDFGDGTSLNGGPTEIHLYGLPGLYTITLMVTDAAGIPTTANQTVTVS